MCVELTGFISVISMGEKERERRKEKRERERGRRGQKEGRKRQGGKGEIFSGSAEENLQKDNV